MLLREETLTVFSSDTSLSVYRVAPCVSVRDPTGGAGHPNRRRCGRDRLFWQLNPEGFNVFKRYLGRSFLPTSLYRYIPLLHFIS
jgi:hypothetical protein